MKKIMIILLLIYITLSMSGCGIKAETTENEKNSWKNYTNIQYHVSFFYPASWKQNPKYTLTDRFEGENGFFQIDAISSNQRSIDEVTEYEAFHKLHPYGSNPQIISAKIHGEEARFIFPSNDQPKTMQNQSGLIVQYPTPIKINNTMYPYFILRADERHIRQISKTLSFIY